MLQNYEQLIEKISSASGLSKDEVDRKVEAKCAKLSGLISKEGSAQIVASELGISFDKEKMKVSELIEGMRKVNIIGKVIEEPRINSFTTKAGNEGKVASFTIGDDSGNIRTVLWDTSHIALFEEGKLKNEGVVDISNASIRNGELHLGSFSEIKESSETIENVITEKRVPERKISDIKPGNNVRLRAVLVQMFEPKFFEVCPQCSKKAVDSNCVEHGAITPERRSLISVVLDDGTENMRAVAFSEQVNQFGITDQELNIPEMFEKKKRGLLGNEFFFTCNVRINQMFNNNNHKINPPQNCIPDVTGNKRLLRYRGRNKKGNY